MRYTLAAVLAAGMIMLSGCGNSHEEAESSQSPSASSEKAEFRKIDWQAGRNQIKMTGEATSSNGVFYYKAEQQDGTELIAEQKVDLKHDGIWVPFEIPVSQAELKQTDVAIFILYTKDRSGKPTSANHIPLKLDQMQKQ